MKILKLAVIGKDVSKSASPQIHKFIAEREGYGVEYEAVSVAESAFPERIEKLLNLYDGLNVTIPFKLSVIPYLKKTEGDALTFGSVNTVRTFDKTGFNTDGEGFSLMLSNNGINCSGKRVLVLGAGGAGRTVAKKLADGRAEVFIYDKNFTSSEAVSNCFSNVKPLGELKKFPCFAVINATGVGMHNTEGISPVGEEMLSDCEVAVDLIYAPEKSRFLNIAEKLGKKTLNGAAMLFYQAYFSECIFTGRQPSAERAKKLFNEFSREGI